MDGLERARLSEEKWVSESQLSEKTVEMPKHERPTMADTTEAVHHEKTSGQQATVTDIRIRLRKLAMAAARERKLRQQAAEAARQDIRRKEQELEQTGEQLKVVTVHRRTVSAKEQEGRAAEPLPVNTKSPEVGETRGADIVIPKAMQELSGQEIGGQEATRQRSNHTGSRYAEQEKQSAKALSISPRVLLALAAVVLLTGYVAMAVHFHTHFYPRTTIYGVTVDGMTAAQATEAVRNKVQSYALTLQGRESVQERISAAKVGLQYEDDGTIQEALDRQTTWFWPFVLLFGRSHSTGISTVYEEGKVDALLEELSILQPENMTAPEDARLGETENGYEVLPEIMGTTLDLGEVRRTVQKALDSGKTQVNLELSGCYVEPEIYADNEELNAQAQELNALFGAQLALNFGDRTEMVDASVIRTFIGQFADGRYYIDPEKVWAYTAELAQKYDTYGGYRLFQTSLGTEVELFGGDYGWELDQDTTAQEILDQVRAKVTGTLEPTYYHTALCRDANDIGDTYVEVSIEAQEMWVYQDGELMVDTPVVTGNPSKGNATPAGGVWEIDGKYRNQILIGEGYRQPVDYWIPFNGGVGIHDLQSRYYFGGTIYLTNGSHGCVNTPLDAVTEIFDIVYAGVPVVVYE